MPPRSTPLLRGILSPPLILAVLWLATLLPAAQAPPQDPLIQAAYTAAPELGADLLITLSRDTTRPRKQRLELLNNAFDMSSGAHYPFPLFGIARGTSSTDTDSGLITGALVYGLDTLSLRSRAIEQLLLLDAPHARQLFESMLPLRIPALTCGDSLGVSVQPFYNVGQAILHRGFTPKELADGKHVAFAQLLLSQVTTPSQIAPAVSLLLRDQWRPDELSSLLSTFTSMLAQLSSDNRSFQGVIDFSLMQALVELDSELRSKGIDPFPLIQTWRAWLLRHLKAPRCPDFVNSQSLPGIVRIFNTSLAPKYPNLSPLTPDDLVPDRIVDQRHQVISMWSTPETQRLLAGLRTLRFGTPEQTKEREEKVIRRPDNLQAFLSDAERSTMEWRAALDAYMKEFHEWESHSEDPPLIRFAQQCAVLRGLIILVTDRPRQLALMREHIQRLASSEFRTLNPPVWRMMLRRALTATELSPTDRQTLLDIAKSSGNVYIATFASLPIQR